MIKKGLILFLTITILQGCNGLSNKEEMEIVQKSTHSARAYFKEEMGYDVVINKHEFTTRTNGKELFLYGYEKGNKENRIMATVNYAEEKYKVDMIGYDEK